MLELYHHGSSVCAAKVRIVLAEKGLQWKGHYLDILKGDQFDPEYMKLNPKAVVPTLVLEGKPAGFWQAVYRDIEIVRATCSGSASDCRSAADPGVGSFT